MPFAVPPIMLQNDKSLDPDDVETNYSAIVSVVGGSYFVKGVATTSNGSLDWRNFSPAAGITNQFKIASNSFSIVQIQSTQPISLGLVPATYIFQQPIPQLQTPTTILEAGVFVNISPFGAPSAILATPGSIAFNAIRGGLSQRIGTTISFPFLYNGAYPTPVFNLTGNASGIGITNTQLLPGDYLSMTFVAPSQVATPSIVISSISCAFTLKSQHTR